MSIGHKIIEYISDANLVSPRCVQDESHDIINVWSSQSPEQLEALVLQHFDVLRKWQKLCEIGLEDSVPEWMKENIKELWDETDVALGKNKENEK